MEEAGSTETSANVYQSTRHHRSQWRTSSLSPPWEIQIWR